MALDAADPANRRLIATFTVVNKGRGDTTIVGFNVTPYGERKPVVDIASQQVVGGPPLPHRMEGNSQETWYVNVLPAARTYGEELKNNAFKPNSSWPSMMFFTVKAGNGKFSHAKSSKFDAYSIVAETYSAGNL